MLTPQGEIWIKGFTLVSGIWTGSALQAHGIGGTQPCVAASRDYSRWQLAGLHGQQLVSGIATEGKTLGASLPCWNAAMVRSGPGDIKLGWKDQYRVGDEKPGPGAWLLGGRSMPAALQ